MGRLRFLFDLKHIKQEPSPFFTSTHTASYLLAVSAAVLAVGAVLAHGNVVLAALALAAVLAGATVLTVGHFYTFTCDFLLRKVGVKELSPIPLAQVLSCHPQNVLGCFPPRDNTFPHTALPTSPIRTHRPPCHSALFG